MGTCLSPKRGGILLTCDGIFELRIMIVDVLFICKHPRGYPLLRAAYETKEFRDVCQQRHSVRRSRPGSCVFHSKESDQWLNRISCPFRISTTWSSTWAMPSNQRITLATPGASPLLHMPAWRQAYVIAAAMFSNRAMSV